MMVGCGLGGTGTVSGTGTVGGGAMWALLWWSWVDGYGVFWDMGATLVSLPIL